MSTADEEARSILLDMLHLLLVLSVSDSKTERREFRTSFLAKVVGCISSKANSDHKLFSSAAWRNEEAQPWARLYW